MTGHVRRQKFITRAEVRANSNTIFVFGDNMQGRGMGGQAKEMRFEPNAIGVPTKWEPSMRQASFFSDADFNIVQPDIDRAFNRIRQAMSVGSDIVIPVDGLGTGLADLPRRAPRIHRYIEDKIADLEKESPP